MPTYLLFSVRDQLNGFGMPLCDLSEAAAIRSFKMALSDPSFYAASDYDLYLIGSFNMATGLVESLPAPKLIYRGASIGMVKYNPADSPPKEAEV